ncbi:argininosuccinate synthase [Culicoides brevitarsis]|uniref:argininosuccinate synthase n=1 Tax=Culicoides brevitarsis TaxID=469753 RepID=UPI00307B9230
MSREKVLLAYSGGLDTSCILKWLLEKDYEVICFMADVGQEEDFLAARQKALKIGASEVVIKDMKNTFVTQYIWPAIQMGLIYEDRYLLGTSLARPCITVGLLETAKEFGCSIISHGATGKGNDQVRFELSAYAIDPSIRVIAPWREREFCDKFQGRTDLLAYAKANNIPVSASPKEPWSMDANIMHISYESGILEDPGHIAPENLYLMTKDPVKGPNIPSRVEITFSNGFPIRVSELSTGTTFIEPLDILTFLNKIGGEHGVGRVDIVENRFIGMKSRGVYESPGAKILHCAHQDMEIFCLDREVYRLKKHLQEKMADFVYNGLWFSPEAEFARSCLSNSQKNVRGKVVVEMFKGNVMAIARESVNSLYNKQLCSMDVHGTFLPEKSSGFIEITAMRLKETTARFGTPNFNVKMTRKNSTYYNEFK